MKIIIYAHQYIIYFAFLNLQSVKINCFKFHCSLFTIKEEQLSKFSFLLAFNNLVLIYIDKTILHILKVKQLQVQENIAFKIPVLIELQN